MKFLARDKNRKLGRPEPVHSSTARSAVSVFPAPVAKATMPCVLPDASPAEPPLDDASVGGLMAWPMTAPNNLD